MSVCVKSLRQNVCLGIILAIIMCMSDGISGRQVLAPLIRVSHREIPQVLLDELMDNANEEIKRYPENHQQNFLSRWPWLGELMLPSEYYDEATANENLRMNNQLMQLTLDPNDDGGEDDVDDDNTDSDTLDDLPEIIPTPLPLKKNPPIISAKVHLKEHGKKKNVHLRKEYMSPCHFKICNMGRKRDAPRFYF